MERAFGDVHVSREYGVLEHAGFFVVVILVDGGVLSDVDAIFEY
jgi:hypothetical protein